MPVPRAKAWRQGALQPKFVKIAAIWRLRAPERGGLAWRFSLLGIWHRACIAQRSMRTNSRSAAYGRLTVSLLLALGSFAACRSPQDPSGLASPLGPDAGTTPTNPEIQPNTGKPIGPIAISNGGNPAAAPEQGGPGGGGVGGGSGNAGAAGRNRVASR